MTLYHKGKLVKFCPVLQIFTNQCFIHISNWAYYLRRTKSQTFDSSIDFLHFLWRWVRGHKFNQRAQDLPVHWNFPKFCYWNLKERQGTLESPASSLGAPLRGACPEYCSHDNGMSLQLVWPNVKLFLSDQVRGNQLSLMVLLRGFPKLIPDLDFLALCMLLGLLMPVFERPWASQTRQDFFLSFPYLWTTDRVCDSNWN